MFVAEYRRRLLHWAAERVRSRVNETTWQAFWLTAMEGQNVPSVAEQLGITSGNVYAAKFRVTARIQKMVGSISGIDEHEWSRHEGQ